jgi:replicative DNA helicase
MNDTLIERYYSLFAGRPDVYAIRAKVGDGVVYLPSTHPESVIVKRTVKDIGTDEYCDAVVEAHLAGDHFIGVYPIHADSTVFFFALDFDRKKDTDPDPWDAAVRQAEVLKKEAGLDVYLERSQSGNGYHIWGFLEEAVDAGRLRHALRQFIELTDTYDRMFPNQDGVLEGRPLGNLIALPLHGKRVEQGNSVFVRAGKDGRPIPFEDQEAFLMKVNFIPTETIDELFDTAPEKFQQERDVTRTGDPEALRGAYKVVDPRFGCEWVRWCFENPEAVTEPLWHALACQFAQLEEGRELFHKWSAQDGDRYDSAATDRKFDHALRENKPHTCETIRELGGNCYCDERFPKRVKHPYDLAKLPFKLLAESMDTEDTDAFVQDGVSGMLAAIQWVEAVERDPSIGQGIPYGIPAIDERTGLRDSDLIILAARPGLGKTAYGLFVSDNLAMRNVPVYFFSLEMSEAQVYKRLLSVRAGVSQTRMSLGQLTRDDWDKLNGAQKQIEQGGYPLFVDDLSRSTERVFEVAANLVHEHGKGVIMFDYLQLAQRMPRESQFDAVTRITQDLKLLAKTLGVPVFAMAQLNRAADDATSDSQTYDSWLRGCLAPDTQILRADTNTTVAIGELAQSGEKNIPVWAVGADGKIAAYTMTEAFSSGHKMTYRMTTRSGRSIGATANHPFLTVNGWTPLADLTSGSRIAVPRRVGEALDGEDVLWDEVVSIEELAMEEVFDATVPGAHNFIANGIIVHNSGEIEQAADVIMFLLGEKGPGVKERHLALHKERHREAGMRVVLEFNQTLMQFAEAGTWLTSPAMGEFSDDVPTNEGTSDDDDLFGGL